MSGLALSIARRAPRIAPQIYRSYSAKAATISRLSQIKSIDFEKTIPIRKTPLEAMTFRPFRPPLDNETPDEYDARLAAQSSLLLTSRNPNSSMQEPRIVSHNVHENDMLIGTHVNPITRAEERYLVKGFPKEELPLVRREIATAYLGFFLGLGQYFPKVYGIQKEDLFVLRRFVRGMDTRHIIGNPAEANKIPTHIAVTLYLVHVLFQENDIDNIRNAIITHNSAVVHQPLFLIDLERTFPTEQVMALLQQRGMEQRWSPGEPIKGTFEWRETVSQEIGPDAFIEKLLEPKMVKNTPTLNPCLAILKEQGYTPETLKKLIVPRNFIIEILNAVPLLNGVLVSNGVYTTAEIQSQTLSFHKTLQAWQECIDMSQDISVANLMTGIYAFPKKTTFYLPEISVVTP